MKHVGTGREFHTQTCSLIASRAHHLALRKAACVHKEYKHFIFNLFIVPSDCWRCRRRATTFAPEARLTHPTSQLKVIDKYGDSRSQEREPVSTLDG